jgi:D-beta-D-heptose 7-phosphate kinase/D-beta-D-heptose 1-phosphate adenosyltransferase
MQAAIRQAIAAFPQKTVAVLGDLMLDVYEYGVVARLSPEAPVPVVRMEQRVALPGGAANAARNARACGAKVTLFGVVGDDAAGRELLALTGKDGVATRAVFTDPTRPTTEKKRIVGPEGHMLRVDYESVASIGDALSTRIATALAAALPGASALIIADYAKGVMSRKLAEKALALARAAGIPVVVDTKPAHADFYAAPTVLTPNAQEARAMAGTDDLLAAGAALVRRFGAPVIVTRGAEGMSLFSDAPPLHLDAIPVEVADVSGAGDTVTVGVALGLAAGLDLADAMRLANTMAAVAVSKKGTAAVSAGELLKALA